MKEKILSSLLAAALVCVFMGGYAPSAEATEFPTREISLVVPHGPGGGADLLSRIISAGMEGYLGVPIIVRPMPGANTAIGNTFVLNAPADGYTILLYSEPTTYISQISQEVHYTVDDFVGIGGMNMDTGFLAVRMESPFETIEDLVAASKEQRLIVGLSQRFGIHAFSTLRMAEELGMNLDNLVLLPYDSSSEQNMALLGGHIDFMGRAGMMPDPNTVRILAVAWNERLPGLEDVPTVKEITGNDLRIIASRGLSAHRDTPPEILAKLKGAFNYAINKPEIREQIEAIGMGFANMSGEEFDALNKELRRQVDERIDLFIGS